VPEPRALPAGTRLGKYEIVERIAIGGMAELYLAIALGIEGFQKLVVLKRVSPHLQHDVDLVKMFVDEARLAAALDHPNIAQVLDIGRNAGEYFFAMEYLHGRDFRELMHAAKERGGLPLGCAIEVVLGVARGLHHAHERRDPGGEPMGLVHRDVSPANVVITYEGSVKLVDFGIAKAAVLTRKTQAGTLMGKVGYMSPEQCLGESADRKSDVFALGILLYEATTGQRPFRADSQFAVMNQIIHGRWKPPGVVVPGYPERLAAIVARAMATDPHARYPTAHALQLELEAFAHEAHVLHSPAVLADYIRDTLGVPDYPTAKSSSPFVGQARTRRDDNFGTMPPLSIATSRSQPTGLRRILLYCAVGAVAALAATRLTALAKSEPEPSATPVAAPTETSPSMPAVAIERAAPSPATAAESPVVSEPLPAASPPTPPSPPSERAANGIGADAPRKKPSTKRKSTRPAKSSERRKGNESLYPPSYYGK
jgi:serine/threonine-protein kinase